MRSRRGVVAAALAVLLASACTAVGDQPEAEGPACGPPSYAEIRGRAPAYVPERLDSFAVDRAMCEGLWLPRSGRLFVPQGLVVEETTATVSGYDGGGPPGTKHCRLLRVDLRTGKLLQDKGPFLADPARPSSICRHAGGIVLDDAGLWLVETERLWLLDPDTWQTRRLWDLADPLKGSLATQDAAGRLAIVSFRDFRRGKVWWYDKAAILEPGVDTLGEDDAVEFHRGPEQAQGAVWADLGPGPERLWFSTSNTLCGNLVARGGRARSFVPGAEGMQVAADGSLWVLSESASAVYYRKGGRPVVPMLARFELDQLRTWPDADCRP